MIYKFITENNLENKQNYMYSEYCGKEFLTAYKKSRNVFFDTISFYGSGENHAAEYELNMLDNKLCDINVWNNDDENVKLINAYVKTFEVRKRLYTKYDLDWHPAEDSNYTDFDNYLSFGDCLVKAYRISRCTKYLSCLLKLNDTILSISNELTIKQRIKLSFILKAEIEFVEEKKKSMGLEVIM